MQQITPPAAVIRNFDPKLAVEPTVIVPPEIKLAMNNNMPNLGDPKSSTPIIPSNGTGSGAGIGSGSGAGMASAQALEAEWDRGQAAGRAAVCSVPARE